LLGEKMRVTTTSRYGVRALFDVSYHGGGEPTQIKDISRRQKISQRYLEQIFNRLLKAGLLKSRRGPRGGYMLAKDASEITVGDIIQAAQGPIIPVRCLGEDLCKRGSCEVCEGCITRHVWKKTQQILVDYYNSVTIADLCALARKEGISRELDHKYMYFI
jgi:Rrf2 family transcriptional regulator, iron-sulfur cluster assembly transcription factor